MVMSMVRADGAARGPRCVSVGPRRRRLPLLPRSRDGHVDGAVERIGVAPAGPVEQLVAGEHAPRTHDEAGEQTELGAGERDRLARLGLQPARVQVDDEAVEGEAAAWLRLAMAARSP